MFDKCRIITHLAYNLFSCKLTRSHRTCMWSNASSARRWWGRRYSTRWSGRAILRVNLRGRRSRISGMCPISSIVMRVSEGRETKRMLSRICSLLARALIHRSHLSLLRKKPPSIKIPASNQKSRKAKSPQTATLLASTRTTNKSTQASTKTRKASS